MKGEFITFDPQSCNFKDAAPKMHFANCGVISFNASAVKLLDLHAGDCVILKQSKRNAKEWFVVKVKEGFPLRNAYDKKVKSLMFNNASLVKMLMGVLNVTKGFGVKIGLQPDEDGWWSLITSGIK